jgi:DNA replication and repair protein RecF
MVSPADSDLIRGGSDERRRFLDLIISQQDKQYLHALIQYNKALLQRNILLKNQNTDTSLYEVLEMQLDMYGRMVFEKRQLLVESFIPIFNEYYQTICRSTEQVGLGYISQLADRNLAESLAANRERDRILGYTSNGVHKDELEMTLNEQLIRRAGSQGQNKTYLIALKLAQFAFLTRKGQTTPILLLDDIFDKLDAARVAEIIKLVSGDSFGQIFITDTNRKYLDEILQAMNHDYALFRVEQGEVQPMEDQP